MKLEYLPQSLEFSTCAFPFWFLNAFCCETFNSQKNHLFFRDPDLGAVSLNCELSKQVETIRIHFGDILDPPVHIDPRYLDSDLRGFRLARDAGFNLLTGTQIEPNIDRSFEGMKCALKLAGQTGLQYLVTDKRFYPAYGCIFDKSKAKELVDAPEIARESEVGYVWVQPL